MSAIDPTKPVAGTPTTLSVRDNFAAAKSEIEALQSGANLLPGYFGPDPDEGPDFLKIAQTVPGKWLWLTTAAVPGGTTGEMYIGTGIGLNTGLVEFTTGNALDPGGVSGEFHFYSGGAHTAPGKLDFGAGNNTGGGNGGAIQFLTGSGFGTGIGGDLSFAVGDRGAAATTHGKITFKIAGTQTAQFVRDDTNARLLVGEPTDDLTNPLQVNGAGVFGAVLVGPNPSSPTDGLIRINTAAKALSITTLDNGAAGSTGVITIQSGAASSGSSGQVTVTTGASTSFSGSLNIKTGNSSTTSSGSISLQTGSATAATTGIITIQSGSSSDNTTGSVTLRSGTISSTNTFASGNVIIGSGNNASTGGGNSGTLSLTSGNVSNSAGGLSGDVTLASGNVSTTTKNSGAVNINSGTVTNTTAVSGAINVISGAAGGTSASGIVTVTSGVGTTGGTSGAAVFGSGNTANGPSGNVTLASGTPSGASATGNTGTVTIATGSTTSNTPVTGAMTLQTGSAGNAGSGAITIKTGSAGNSGTGAITIQTGIGTGSGGSGSITLQTGTAAGTRGSIILDALSTTSAAGISLTTVGSTTADVTKGLQLATNLGIGRTAGRLNLAAPTGNSIQAVINGVDVLGITGSAVSAPLGTLIVGNGPLASTAAVQLNAAAGQAKVIQFYTNAQSRWQMGANNTAEGGSNAGSDWALQRFSDAGALLDTVVDFTRSSGLTRFPVGTVQIGTGGGTVSAINLYAAAGNAKTLTFFSSSTARWIIQSNNTAEGGSNAGSDWQLQRYADGGTLIDTPITVTRSTGITLFGQGISFGAVTGASTTDLSKHVNLHTTGYGFNVTSARLNMIAPSAGGVYVALSGTDRFFVTNTLVATRVPIEVTLSGGPTINAGTGAATGTQPSGSIWLRTDGAAGTRIYISQGGGTWTAIAGV